MQRGLIEGPGHWGVLGMQKGFWGEEMKHFTMEKWIDFVNKVMTASEKEAMGRHLEQGCKRCVETVSLWQRVRKSADVEVNYQAPEATVRIIKSAFAGAGLKGQRKGAAARISVFFDSFLEPVIAGARSAGAGTRQMLYRADPFQIDVQIEARSGGNRLVVTGQLMDLSNPAIVGRDVRVALSNMRGNVAHAVTNQFGEFSAEVDNTGDLQITFDSPGDRPIVISLRDALGKLPGSRG